MLLLKLLFKRTIKNDEKIKEEFLRIYNLTEVQAADDHENLASHLINDHLLYIMVLGIFGIAILITGLAQMVCITSPPLGLVPHWEVSTTRGPLTKEIEQNVTNYNTKRRFYDIILENFLLIVF